MDLSTLQQRLSGIAQSRVACVGDLMVDRYVYGEVEPHLARGADPGAGPRRRGGDARAPSAMWRATSRRWAPRVALAGVIGDDAPGHEAAP